MESYFEKNQFELGLKDQTRFKYIKNVRTKFKYVPPALQLIPWTKKNMITKCPISYLMVEEGVIFYNLVKYGSSRTAGCGT